MTCYFARLQKRINPPLLTQIKTLGGDKQWGIKVKTIEITQKH